MGRRTFPGCANLLPGSGFLILSSAINGLNHTEENKERRREEGEKKERRR